MEEDYLTKVRRIAETWLAEADTNLIQKNMSDIYDSLVKNQSGNVEGSLALIYLLINVGPLYNKESYTLYKDVCSYLFSCCDPPILDEVQGNA